MGPTRTLSERFHLHFSREHTSTDLIQVRNHASLNFSFATSNTLSKATSWNSLVFQG